MKYPVTLIKSEEGYAVSCPALPGCWSQGNTRAEALANIQDAIRLWLEVAFEEGQKDLEQEEGIEVTHASVEFNCCCDKWHHSRSLVRAATVRY